MQVALILSGHLRSFETCAITLGQKITGPIKAANHKVKIFVDTWDTIGGVPQNDGGAIDVKTSDKLETINVLYENPILRIEDYKQLDGSKYANNHGTHFGTHFALSMFYKIQRGYELYKEYYQESGWVADCVIRCRPDLYFLTELDTSTLNSLDCIWTPDFADFGGMNDQFGFGPPELMQHFFNTYENIDRMFDGGLSLHPESLVDRNVKDNKILVNKTHLRYDLLRAGGQRISQWQ